jgi:hypothetical protein
MKEIDKLLKYETAVNEAINYIENNKISNILEDLSTDIGKRIEAGK